MKSSITSPPPPDTAILIIGDPGARKTTLALHAPAPYIFDMDHNSASPGKQVGRPYMYDFAGIDDDGKEVPMRSRYARMVTCINVAAQSPEVRTIILDSFTSLIDIIIEEVRRQDPKISNPLAPLRIQDWGTFAHLFKHIITTLRTSGKYLICTAHQKLEMEEATKSWKYFLNVPGQSATNISGLFTDVWNPFPNITGAGSALQHKWMVRCLPGSENDHRGIKSSFSFKKTELYEHVADTLSKLP